MKKTISKLKMGLIAISLCIAAVTAASSQGEPRLDVDALAARGEILTNQDQLAIELRDSLPQPDAPRGFYIGMAVAEEQTAPGPGKDKTCVSLPSGAERGACALAVRFSVDRNKYADLAKNGAAISRTDPSIAAIRNARDDAFYKLGFDIGLASAEGHTAEGPGKGQRCASLLSPASQVGCRKAVTLSVERNRNNAALGASSGTTPPPPVKADQPANTIKVSVKYKKEFGYKGDTNAFGYVGPTSCSAFSISVAVGDGSAQKGNPTRVSSDSKMRDSDGYYVCSYLAIDIPLDQPVRVSASLAADLDQSTPWKGGSQPLPPPGQQRTIIIVSGRDGAPLTLTAAQPRGEALFEMIYASGIR